MLCKIANTYILFQFIPVKHNLFNCAKINTMLTKTKNYNSIYDDMLEQFPKEELKQREHFLELFNNNYVLYEYSEEKDTDTKGYCIVFEGKEYILTDYLAIFKKFHSKGFGAKIIEELKHLYPEKLGCFFEVEPIEANNIQTQRRAKFYQKQNANKLNFNYLYPNQDGYIPLDLYYLPCSKNTPAKKQITNFIKEFFFCVHKDIEHIEQVYEKILEINQIL